MCYGTVVSLSAFTDERRERLAIDDENECYRRPVRNQTDDGAEADRDALVRSTFANALPNMRKIATFE